MNIYHILFVCEIYIIIALATNLVSGYTGLLSFANAAFYGIGAYTTSILMKEYSFSFLTAIGFAMVFNGFISLIISAFALRMKDLFFTLSTLGFQIIVFNVVYNWEHVTGGSLGYAEIPPAKIGSIVFQNSQSYSILAAVLLSLVFSFFWAIQKTPFVRVLESIRDAELGAISLGKNVERYKTLCNALSAMIIAISGGLFAVYNAYIDPTSFTLDESILIISMLLIGGTGNLAGPVFGACFYVILPELLRFVPISTSQGASLRMMVYSLILILVVRYKPNGVFGKYRFL